jgi:hypothetical protein
MHHLRLTLNGADRDVARMSAELESCGAARLDASAPLGFVWSTADGDRALEELSARHPRVVVGVERFEALGDELVRAILRAGATCIVERNPIRGLCDGDQTVDWGMCMDEDGQVLDPALVRAAAERVAALPASFPMVSPLTGVVELARALGRLSPVELPVGADAPGPGAISALLDLANVALTVGAYSHPTCPAEMLVARSWILARAHGEARAETLWDVPRAASWTEWLATIAICTSDALDAGCHCVNGTRSDAATIFGEHWPTCTEQYEAAAGGLLTTCLQALVLFSPDAGHPAPSPREGDG